MESVAGKFYKYINSEVDSFLNWNIIYTLVVLSCGIVFIKYQLRKYNYSKIFPSRPTALTDIWGCLYDFMYSSKTEGLPLNVYAMQIAMGYEKLFKNEKFVVVWFCYTPIILITKAEAVEEFISGTRNLEKFWIYDWLHPWLGTGLLTSHGSKWKSRRKLLTPSFHFEILKDFMPTFNKHSQILVKLLENETSKPWTDITRPITMCSLDIVCDTTLGVCVGAQQNSESEYVQAVLRASEVLLKRIIRPPYMFDWFFWPSALGRQFKKDIQLLHNFSRAVIFKKKSEFLNGDMETKRKKRRALIDVLLEEHIQNQTLAEEDIREEVDTFMFEGHDTTSMGISWALYLIGLYKDVQENIHEELYKIFGDDVERPVSADDLKYMGYLERILKESHRLYPSVPMFGRKFNEDTPLCGYTIPKGNAAAIMPSILHRDERMFPNPEKFDPDRFLPENSAGRHPYAYIPFSAGPRNCIGQRFAMMEEKVMVAHILRNYSIESLDPRDKVFAVPELILRPFKELRIRLRSRRALID